jgi:hypothetical protein
LGTGEPDRALSSAKGRTGKTALTNLVLPLAAAIATLALWDSFVVYPFKIFVVFLHELSHGLAAVASGGEIVRIELSFDQGGVCLTRGGSAFLILNAGYLGSLLWGALLLVVGTRSRQDRALVGFIGAVTLAITLIYVRSLFGFVYGVTTGSLLLLIAWLLPTGVSDALVKAVGMVSCLYAIWDIGSDALFRSIPESDAHALARLTGVPGVVWGGIWVVLAVGVTVQALIFVARSPGELRPAEPTPPPGKVRL